MPGRGVPNESNNVFLNAIRPYDLLNYSGVPSESKLFAQTMGVI